MARAGLRIAVIGATGALGAELIEALSRSAIRVAQLVPVASPRSLGNDLEFQGEVVPIETEMPSMRGLDFVFLCAPRPVSREAAREALRAEVPGLDLSGALAGVAELSLEVAAVELPAPETAGPFAAAPAGPALAWAHVLHPLALEAGLRRVVGTVLDSASVAGVRGADALMSESLALFNQQDLPEPSVFTRRVAFDCGPGAIGPQGGEEIGREDELAADLARLIGRGAGYAVTSVQVPTFLGQASSLAVETEEILDPDDARALLAKATGVEVWPDRHGGPSTRAAAGRDDVLVGEIRRDPTSERGLLLWIASDPACLAAANAVALAEARLGVR